MVSKTIKMAAAKFPETTQFIQAHAAIPKLRLRAKLYRTAVGSVIVMAGVAGAQTWQWPWYAALFMIVIGASTWSSELVLAPIRAVVPLAVDIIRAVRGK